MAAFHAHGPLVAFLHDLDTNTAAGATKEFLAALGRKLGIDCFMLGARNLF